MEQPHPLRTRPAIRNLLEHLHALSLHQEAERSARGTHFPLKESDKVDFERQLVALDHDKCQAMYLILRAMGARRVIEAGTSYGVSLLWLLAAVTANDEAALSRPLPAVVIGTENEPSKVAKAVQHVREAFEGNIPACLCLLEGDLLKTLAEADIPEGSIDSLLLDIWAPLALSTLKIVLPKLRKGAVVFIDNSVSSRDRFEELLKFIRAPVNGFQSTTLPYSGGFEMAVFCGEL